jgi:hypothetical protein
VVMVFRIPSAWARGRKGGTHPRDGSTHPCRSGAYAAARCCVGLMPRMRLKAVLSANELP